MCIRYIYKSDIIVHDEKSLPPVKKKITGSEVVGTRRSLKTQTALHTVCTLGIG